MTHHDTPQPIRNGLVIIAKFPNTCPACRRPISPGHRICQADTGGWMHHRCDQPGGDL